MRAWTIRKGTKAPAAAGVIHSDFEKNFVCGEIMRFEDLKELGSEAAVRAGGKYNTKGKEYEVQVPSLNYEIANVRMVIFVTGNRGRNSILYVADCCIGMSIQFMEYFQLETFLRIFSLQWLIPCAMPISFPCCE